MNNPKKKKKKVSPKSTGDSPLVHCSSAPETTDDSKLIYVGGLVGFEESRKHGKTFKQLRQEMKEHSLIHNRQLLYESTTSPLQKELQKELEDLLEEEIGHIIHTEWSALPAALERVFEERSFYIFRTDTNAVLARNVQGFEQAKKKSNRTQEIIKIKMGSSEVQIGKA